MVAFERESELTHELDWELWSTGFVNLFWSMTVLDKTTTWLTAHGYQVVTNDAARWIDEDNFHADIAAALEFPDWYGNNLNAFNDCLNDVAEGAYGLSIESTGLVLVLLNVDRLLAEDRDLAERVLEIWADQARHAALIGHRLMCLAQTNDPRTVIRPLAHRVSWNPAEWADRARGV